MFNPNLYHFDRTKISELSSLADGAYLYRLTSVDHAGSDEILNGRGPVYSAQCGRYNEPGQETSYCANNVIVSISEVLYHMYRTVLDRIEQRMPPRDIHDTLRMEKALAIFKVNGINDLVYVDSEDVKMTYDHRLCGTSVVFPDSKYSFLNDFNRKARMLKKKGVVYPSARHSRDLCFAVFGDETKRVIDTDYEVLILDLQIIHEDQTPIPPMNYCKPFEDKLHPTMGFYKFRDPVEFLRVKSTGILNPSDLPESGMVDFVRRQYVNYPIDAVR